jgi:hypothetical protein
MMQDSLFNLHKFKNEMNGDEIIERSGNIN